MLRGLARDADRLSHLSVDRRFRSTTLVSALLHVGPVTLFVSLARGFLFLLLRFPFLSDFLEFCNNRLASYSSKDVKMPRKASMGRQLLASAL
jgi:hypothetical protein